MLYYLVVQCLIVSTYSTLYLQDFQARKSSGYLTLNMDSLSGQNQLMWKYDEREEYHTADKNSFMTIHCPDFLNRISEFCHFFFLHRQISQINYKRMHSQIILPFFKQTKRILLTFKNISILSNCKKKKITLDVHLFLQMKCLSINSYLLEINSDAEQSWLMDEKTTG